MTNPYLDESLMAGMMDFTPKKIKKFEKKHYVKEKIKKPKPRPVIKKQPPPEQAQQQPKQPKSPKAEAHQKTLSVQIEAGSVAKQVSEYQDTKIAPPTKTENKSASASASASDAPSSTKLKPWQTENTHAKNMSVDIKPGTVTQHVSEYANEENKDNGDDDAGAHSKTLSVDIEAGSVANRLKAFQKRAPAAHTRAANIAGKRSEVSLALDEEDLADEKEEVENKNEAEHESDADMSWIKEVPEWMEEGIIVRFTGSLAVLQKEWDLAELGANDELGKFLNAAGTVEEIDDDGTINILWANGDTSWMPTNACKCDMDATPQPFYTNDVWIYTRFRYGVITGNNTRHSRSRTVHTAP